jgi:hypothetical protein
MNKAVSFSITGLSGFLINGIIFFLSVASQSPVFLFFLVPLGHLLRNCTRFIVAGFLVAGFLVAGFLVAGFLVAGFLVAGFLFLVIALGFGLDFLTFVLLHLQVFLFKK